MEVYVDVLFIINFVMDFILLWIVNKISKKNVSYKRIVAGAFMGAIILCFMLFIPTFKVIYNVVGFIILCSIMIFITFKVKSIKEFFKLFLLIHITAFTVGGTGIAIFYYTNLGSLISNFFIYQVNNFSIKILIIAVITSFLMIKIFMNWYGKFILNKQKFYSIIINFKNKVVETNGLVDTGNSLVDPFTNMPVIIVEADQLNNILPEQLIQVINQNKENDLKLLTDVSRKTSFGTRLRLIPFSSLGKENGLLIGFRPDYIEIQNNSKGKKTNDVIIGISNKKLTMDDSYHALIHPELID